MGTLSTVSGLAGIARAFVLDGGAGSGVHGSAAAMSTATIRPPEAPRSTANAPLVLTAVETTTYAAVTASGADAVHGPMPVRHSATSAWCPALLAETSAVVVDPATERRST